MIRDNGNPDQILEKYYRIAFDEFKKDNGQSFLNNLDNNQKDWLFVISSKAESFRAIITTLTTSLVKKIENPEQDVRYHRNGLEGGYSGRTYDTKFVTPFFKKHFPTPSFQSGISRQDKR